MCNDSIAASRDSQLAEGRHALQYFLGAHRPHWLALSSQPLFVSYRSLRNYKKLPRASAPWALDSGGFTELNLHGAWVTSPAQYAAAVRRYRDEVGSLVFASQQDWMCEPGVLAKTGCSVREHQAKTIDNYCELMNLAPELPWLPVLQGWGRFEYEQHLEMWMARGIDLGTLPRVGVGSVCRRSSAISISAIVSTLARDYRLPLHAFGIKLEGLRVAGGYLASADSMAWSYAARRENRELGCLLAGVKRCDPNRLETALSWFDERIDPILREGFCRNSGFSRRYLRAPANTVARRFS